MKKEINNNYGIASLVLGIMGVLLALFIGIVGLILSVLAVVFAYQQKKIKPNGLATAGLVMGIIGIVLSIIACIITFAVYFG